MESLTIKLNAQFILEAVNAFGGKGKVSFNFNDNVTPLQFSVGENFAMLCNAKGNKTVSELGSKIFLTTCKHVVGVVEKYGFEK
jgi:DNA polymerase III sliding clamp (beta) subunit (PCNA family)